MFREIDLKTLRHLYLDKAMTLGGVAKELGVSLSLVRTRLIQNGVPLRPKTQVPFEEIRRFYEVESWSIGRIAKKYGISRQAVFDRLKRRGVKFRTMSERGKFVHRNPRRNSIDVEELLIQYRDDKVPITRLAKKYRVSCATVRELLVREGINPSEPFSRATNKYHEIRALAIGESTLIEMQHVKNPWTALHSVANFAGIKFHVRKQNETIFRVTRIG